MTHMKHNLIKFVFAFLMILCCTIVGAYLHINHLEHVLTHDIQEHLLEVVQQSKLTINNKMNDQLEKIESLSKIISLQDSFRLEESLDFLYRYNEDKNFYRIGIILPDGRGYAEDLSGISFNDREYFQKAMQGESNISHIMADKTTGILDNTYAVPIYDEKKKVIAVLASAKPVFVLEDLLDIPMFHGKGFLAIADHQGQVIVAPRPVPNQGAIRAALSKLKQQSQSGVTEIVARDQSNCYMAYWPLGINDWYILSIVPTDVINEVIDELTRMALFLWIGLIALFMGIMFYIFLVKTKHDLHLEEIAFVDAITGYANWNCLELYYQKLLQKGTVEKWALIVFDIDKFKLVNDVYGYQAGNELLKQIAQILAGQQRKDEFSARVTADHFLWLINYRWKDEIVTRIEAFIKQVNLEIISYKLFLSFGIYKIEDRTLAVSILSDRANLAKRTIKGNHQRTYAFYTEELRQLIIAEKEIENDMEQALQSGQFQVYLQPKYSFQETELVGAESLVRWLHPVKGMIYPDQFIALFERNRFIEKLDLYMFERVCQLLQDWKCKMLVPVCVSVNFSYVHLNNCHLPDQLLKMTAAYQVSPYDIEIELTESAIFENFNILRGIMNRLKEYGFKISMDDFGSGYSSLNVLKDLQVDILKFDKAFLNESEEDQRGKDILRNLLQMSKDLALITVAEGVETEAQVEFLKALGFDIAQGYYYAKPMPIESFEILLGHREEKRKVW